METALPAPEPIGPEPQLPPTARPPRRRGRTTLLIAAAALLGVAGGTATGYAVQADRPPAATPPLSQPGLAYPAASLPKGKEPVPLPAGEDSQVKTNGDLRKLLISKPAGARDANQPWNADGWSPLPLYVSDATSPSRLFAYLLKLDVRRIACATWDQGEDRQIDIDLLQFAAGTTSGAAAYAKDQSSYMNTDEGVSSGGDPIRGSGNGRYWLYDVSHKKDYLPYHARAIAQRGSVMVDINVFDSRPISKNDIRTLAERQLERL